MDKTKLQCNECGRKFTRALTRSEVRCSCGSVDVELADAFVMYRRTPTTKPLESNKQDANRS